MGPTSTILNDWQSIWRTASIENRIALQDASTQIRYGQLYTLVSQLAARLRAVGMGEQMRVAINMERGLDAVITLLAVMVAGACPCPLEPGLSPTERTLRLQSGGLTWLLSDDPVRDAGTDDIRVINPLTLADARPYWPTSVSPLSPALMLFTSGSTGKPKGVLESHRGVLNNARGIIAMTELSADDTLLHVMPIYHTNGLNNQLFSPLAVGACIYFAPRFSAQAMPQLMATVGPTIITGVPTMYSRMLAHPLPAEAVRNLRLARCGSAPITTELHKKIESYLGQPLVISYGLSEATCTSTMNPPTQRKVGSIGKPLSGQDIFLLSTNGERITAAHTNGEICIDGDSLMLGYVGVSAPGQLDPQVGPLRTGDIGYADEDGFLYITGRIKDVIIRGGENISPSQIEHVIAMHTDVANCCVIGQPDEDLGEVPVAFITARNSDINIDEVHALLKTHLARIYQPAAIFVLDALPENAVGKVDRKALAKQLVQRTQATVSSS
ncbi:MAG: class I adenylate-forming enzyme family protein [Advenella sp.]|uniref:class I adenylate-forming enzyme family protein n=1 Tax=Advenella sp. TaxID=1872388 RepID=UPI003F9A247C